jgi:geranylgeranyl reductase family protein
MPTDRFDLPEHCDVLVVGAGPAGSACATVLARQGLAVVFVDQQRFPRDKVCGDGLIPDAHRALQRLGVHAEVMTAAQTSGHVACIGPRGGRVDVPGRLAVLPRRELDDILRRHAERAGARFQAPWRFDCLLRDGAGNARVTGARLAPVGSHDGQPRELRATWVVLATGAVPHALRAADVCERTAPSAVALRGYLAHSGPRSAAPALEVVWHPRMRRGYGWVFPGPGGVYNIGVGLAHSHARGADGRHGMADVNLREMMRTFTEVYPPAAALVAQGQWVGPLKGAPLRCSLEGARVAQPGLLVTGEAAGSTYAFTGEGIGKALETGMLAAESIAPEIRGQDGPITVDADTRVIERYRSALAALKPRFDLYERANRVNDHPWLADLLIWRARHSARILHRMSGVLEETGNPGNLVTLRGITRLLLPLG